MSEIEKDLKKGELMDFLMVLWKDFVMDLRTDAKMV